MKGIECSIIGALVLNKQTGKRIGCLVIDALKGYTNKPMAKRLRCSLIGTIILNIPTTKRVGLFGGVVCSFKHALLCFAGWLAWWLGVCVSPSSLAVRIPPASKLLLTSKRMETRTLFCFLRFAGSSGRAAWIAREGKGREGRRRGGKGWSASERGNCLKSGKKTWGKRLYLYVAGTISICSWRRSPHKGQTTARWTTRRTTRCGRSGGFLDSVSFFRFWFFCVFGFW